VEYANGDGFRPVTDVTDSHANKASVSGRISGAGKVTFSDLTRGKGPKVTFVDLVRGKGDRLRPTATTCVARTGERSVAGGGLGVLGLGLGCFAVSMCEIVLCKIHSKSVCKPFCKRCG
jgi:hypothetical protein